MKMEEIRGRTNRRPAKDKHGLMTQQASRQRGGIPQNLEEASCLRNGIRGIVT
jgi:hypothetical protein